MPPTSAHPVVIYGRVSQLRDERSKSVDDQLAELRRWAGREGWPVVAEHRDDGISASRFGKGKRRAGWEQVLDVVNSGAVRAVLVWELSRATRDKAVSAALETTCIVQGVHIGYHGRLHDPRTADGSFQVGLDTLLAAREAAITSERIRRAVASRADRGGPHGSLGYGWRRVLSPTTGATTGYEKHPDEAKICKEIVERLLAGGTANGIAADLNKRKVPPARAKQWSATTVSTLARRPALAALRVQDGRVRDDVRGTWPALIDEADHHALVAMYADPERDRWRNSKTVKHLGVGLYRCGKDDCDGRMGIWHRAGRAWSYRCRGCGGSFRAQEPTDLVVESALVEFLSRPDVAEQLVADDPGASAARLEVVRLTAKLAELDRLADVDEIELREYGRMAAATRKKLTDAEQRARPRHVPDAVFAVAGPDAAARWAATELPDRRVIVAALVDVTIVPGATRRFDPAKVRVVRKT